MPYGTEIAALSRKQPLGWDGLDSTLMDVDGPKEMNGKEVGMTLRNTKVGFVIPGCATAIAMLPVHSAAVEGHIATESRSQQVTHYATHLSQLRKVRPLERKKNEPVPELSDFGELADSKLAAEEQSGSSVGRRRDDRQQRESDVLALAERLAQPMADSTHDNSEQDDTTTEDDTTAEMNSAPSDRAEPDAVHGPRKDRESCPTSGDPKNPSPAEVLCRARAAWGGKTRMWALISGVPLHRLCKAKAKNSESWPICTSWQYATSQADAAAPE
jgi:hypothetical protein